MVNKNPFNPSFGKVPDVFIDREQISETLIDGFQQLSSPYQTTILTGVRGVGKTALLTDVTACFDQKKIGSSAIFLPAVTFWKHLFR